MINIVIPIYSMQVCTVKQGIVAHVEQSGSGIPIWIYTVKQCNVDHVGQSGPGVVYF